MNMTLKLTMDGLIEALRWQALERESAKDDGKPSGVQPDRTSNPKATETRNGK